MHPQVNHDAYLFSLEDTTTQMIEVIWPLSVVPPAVIGRDPVALATGGRSLIDLRTFVQEVLKRSKTSYSTLQVALYYLVLVKPHIPRVDFTKEQFDDSHAARAMQCGRRMFLAALILASKYLQDRNYSARAWSKISGLRVCEINQNEWAFLEAVDYKLHVPESRFQRWTDIVLKYSLGSPPSSPALRGLADTTASWRSLVPRLTPDLDDFEAPASPTPSPVMRKHFTFDVRSMSPPRPTVSPRSVEPTFCTDINQTPVSKPEALEPTFRANNKDTFRFPPISPRIPQLPTPQMTPRPNGFYTPAASSHPHSSTPGCVQSAMGGAMRQIQAMAMSRSAVDTWPQPSAHAVFVNRKFTNPPSRRSSLAPSITSIISSPESMISDTSSQSSQSSQSSRSSRASSISSLASSVGALAQQPLPPQRLAVQATRRCAELQQMLAASHLNAKELPSACQPQPPAYMGHVAPTPRTCVAAPLTIHTGSAEGDPLSSPLGPYCGAPESFLRGSCAKPLTPPEDAETAAALALHTLASGHSDRPAPRRAGTLPHRKRERPLSTADPNLALHASVRENLHAPAAAGTGGADAVAPDNALADSIFLAAADIDERRPRTAVRLSSAPHGPTRAASGSRDGARKRVCCAQEAGRRIRGGGVEGLADGGVVLAGPGENVRAARADRLVACTWLPRQQNCTCRDVGFGCKAGGVTGGLVHMGSQHGG